MDTRTQSRMYFPENDLWQVHVRPTKWLKLLVENAPQMFLVMFALHTCIIFAPVSWFCTCIIQSTHKHMDIFNICVMIPLASFLGLQHVDSLVLDHGAHGWNPLCVQLHSSHSVSCLWKLPLFKGQWRILLEVALRLKLPQPLLTFDFTGIKSTRAPKKWRERGPKLKIATGPLSRHAALTSWALSTACPWALIPESFHGGTGVVRSSIKKLRLCGSMRLWRIRENVLSCGLWNNSMDDQAHGTSADTRQSFETHMLSYMVSKLEQSCLSHRQSKRLSRIISHFQPEFSKPGRSHNCFASIHNFQVSRRLLLLKQWLLSHLDLCERHGYLGSRSGLLPSVCLAFHSCALEKIRQSHHYGPRSCPRNLVAKPWFLCWTHHAITIRIASERKFSEKRAYENNNIPYHSW